MANTSDNGAHERQEPTRFASTATQAPKPVLRRLEQRIGNMRIRLKLMVFHNVFFVLLAFTIYLAIIPALESRLSQAYQREVQLLQALLVASTNDTRQMPVWQPYEHEQGSAAQLGMPEEIVRWLEVHPGEVWHSPGKSDYVYHKRRSSDLYVRVRLPQSHFREMLAEARWAVTLVIGATYIVGVIVLEFFVLPLYVYRPIHLLLHADRASTSGDREHELVPDGAIPDDELGDLMRSRNLTVSMMREQEHRLAQALGQLRQATDDLTTKNQQLETARQNLLDQDRLASLGLLSASVAHELNTPLTVLRGSIQKLREQVDDPRAQLRLQRMERVTDRLGSISSQLLDFARARKTQTSPISLSPLIAESWELVAIDDKASLVHMHNLVDDTVIIQASPDRMIQVFVNLLRNALHEINISGHIWVSAKPCATDPKRIVVRVEDDGAGFSEQILPHLFEAFVSTRLDAHGTGLGLTVAEGIVNQHGGSMRAYNRVEGGACVELSLLAATAHEAREWAAEASLRHGGEPQ